MRLGQFEIQIVSDGAFWLDGGMIFGVVPRVLWEKVMPPDDKNRVRLALNCLLVRTPRKNILVDTGIGAGYDAKFAEIYRVEKDRTLLGELSKLGLGVEDIDVVVNTHLHFDHAGTNTSKLEDGQIAPTFPRATYVVRRGEWEHAHAPNERSRASYVAENFSPLRGSGQLRLIRRDAEIVPGVRVFLTPGHLRHHQSVLIESEGRVAAFLSDLVPTSHHVRLPWIMSLDLYPVDTLQTKRKLLEQALAENWLLIFYHDPQVRAGYLRRSDGKISVQPVQVGE